MRIIIISGLSGSGKSTAVRALEDEGFFCLDNLPVMLVPTFIELVGNSKDPVREVALVMDIRGRDFLKGYERVIQEIRQEGHSVEILFLDATDDVLIRRFSETRRRHPALESGSVPEGIRFEREQLLGLRRIATIIIDTSELNVHQLRELIISRISGEEGARVMTVCLQSFGYRFGLPLEADLVIDVRFLPNPHFIPELREFDGLDKKIRDFVLGKPETRRFLDKFQDMMDYLLPLYRHEGKSYLTVSIGCTGGRHRSVVIVEALREFYTGKDIDLKVNHRDMKKGVT